MRLKVYQAPNIGAAMAMVRTELGPDALILSTRPAEGGVEVTAALETAQPPPRKLVDPARNATLRWHGVPETMRPALAEGELVGALGNAFAFGDLPLQTGARPVLLFGPCGAGKSLTIARLATRLVLAGEKPLVISADGKRAGAAEQLAAFTRLLGLTLIAADEPVTLARALARRVGGAPVLIDTPGLNWADAKDREAARLLLAATAGVGALVIAAGTDPFEAAETAAAFKELGATMLIATRFDQSRRLGAILAAAAAGLTLTEAGVGPGAADGLRPLSAAFLAERIEAGPPRPSPAVATPAPDLTPNRPLPPYIRPRNGQPRLTP